MITHAHGDHARRGSRALSRGALAASACCAAGSARGDRSRATPSASALTFGETTVSFHPAGHVLGSAQIRIEAAGVVWVISGDYKRDPDPSCERCEVVPCDVFITEATFALPIYRWDPIDQVMDEPARLVGRQCRRRPRLGAVLLRAGQGAAGARRARPAHRPARVRARRDRCAARCLSRSEGISACPDGPGRGRDARARRFAGELIIAPPSAFGSPWLRRFGDASTAFASGWMRVRGNRRRRGFDRGFVLSDHVDWPALLRTIERDRRQARARHPWLQRHSRPLPARDRPGSGAAPNLVRGRGRGRGLVSRSR